jgi:predicted methyltransferase
MRAFAPMMALVLGCVRAPAAPPSSPPPALEPAKPAASEQPAESADARTKRIATAIEQLEASYVTENERWTPALEARVAALAEADYRSTAAAIEAVLASPHRVPGNAARDAARHPKEMLLFFGLRQDMRVVEMFPGGGWYTELLAPLLRKRGKLVVPAYDANGPLDSNDTYVGRGLALLLAKSDALFGAVERIPQVEGHPLDLGPDESADMVLAIREMHNWVRYGTFDAYLAAAHAVLVPGGVLGVEQHRASPGDDPIESASRGYLPEPWLIEQVESAGFRLVEKTELNANAKDTKDHPGGVWALPPTLRAPERSSYRARALAIGESDRMTLKFVKRGGS